MSISACKKLISLAAAVAMTLGATGCTKKDDSNPDAKFYTESANLQNADKVSSDVGTQVVLKSTKDFGNEAEYNRILSLLHAHKELVLAHRDEIQRIVIGGSTGMSLIRDRYEVDIGLFTSESDLVHLFTDHFSLYENADRKSTEFSQAIELSVVDTVGLEGSAMKAAATKLRDIARAVNFTQDSGFRQLVLGNSGFAIMPSGMIININSDSGTIVNAIKLGIDARLTWAAFVAPLSQQLGLDFSFQPGVFDGNELQSVIDKVRSSATLISSTNHTFNHVMFGKRSDTDLGTGTILIDYRISSAEIVSALHKFDVPVSAIDLEPIRAEIDLAFAARGFKFDRVIIDVPANATNLAALKSFRFNTAPNVQVEFLRKLHASVLHLGFDPIQFIAGSNALYLNLNSSSANVDSYLGNLIFKSAFTTEDMLFQNYMGGLNISFTENVSYAASQEQNDRYANFIQWFTTSMNAGSIISGKILSLRLSDDGSTAAFTGGILSVDLQTFDPAQIRIILSRPTRN